MASDKKISVGPLDSGSYVYRIGNRISEAKYANSASAWYDARRAQRVNANGRLEPDVDDPDDKYLEALAISKGL